MKTKIVVRDCDGVALIRYLIGSNERVGYLTDLQGVSEIDTIGFTERAIGFPLSDIFWWEERSEICDGDKPDWSQMKHWQTAKT